MNPFYLKKLTGNIRVCQVCRGSLRLVDGSIPCPCHDVVIVREFHNQTGTLKTPLRASAAYYHAWLACVCAADPSFVPSSLVVSPDIVVVLTSQH